MCGDVLGACVSGWSAQKIYAVFPHGLQRFQDHTLGFGRFTDNICVTLALGKSIVDSRGVDPKHVARVCAPFFETVQKYGTVTRILPVGIAYRNAPLHVLHRAVRDVCAPTHTQHPIAVDAAFVFASAIGWLLNCRPAVTYVEKRILQDDFLAYLVDIAQTDTVRGKLQLLAHRLVYMPEPVASWRTYLTCPTWHRERALQLELCEGNPFGIRNCDCAVAVAVALCAFLHHGMTECCTSPQNAFVAACHYGGDTNAVTAMAGACWGALHGYENLPKDWLGDLENSQKGRFRAIEIGYHLVNVDVKSDCIEAMECD